MSSAVTSPARPSSCGLSDSLILRRRAWPSRPVRLLLPADSRRSPPGRRSPTRGCSRSGSVVRVAGLHVEEVTAELGRELSGAVGEQQRSPGPRARERRRRGRVERRFGAGEDEAVAGVVDVPAEAAGAGSGRRRARWRPGPRHRPASPCRRSGGSREHPVGDRRGGSEDVDRSARGSGAARSRSPAAGRRFGEEDRVARARRPGGRRDRQFGQRRRGDDDVGGGEPTRRSRSLAIAAASTGAGPAATLVASRPAGTSAAPIAKAAAPPGRLSPAGVERVERFGGRVGEPAGFGDQQRRPHRFGHQHRAGDGAGPVFLADQRDRRGALRWGGRGEGGERRRGRDRGGVGAADPGRVVGREAREAELRGGFGRAFARVFARRRAARSAGAGAPPRVPRSSRRCRRGRGDDEDDRDHDQRREQLRGQRLRLAAARRGGEPGAPGRC